MRIRVIFVQDVPPRYRAGEVREVAGGYARNYLFPQALAVPATPDNMRRLEKIKKVGEERRQRLAQEMQALAQRIQGQVLTIKARAAEGGKLYGSVSAAAIADALSRAIGQTVERRLIALPQPIKALGQYQVSVNLYYGITPTVTVVVEEEGRASAPEAPASPTTPTPAPTAEKADNVHGETAPA
ncbi:MAG: 50S ribosomal protein L9 [Dehalococcoidia bacterium]|nr:50S ribosomal protein L9 [Dehalococcoidia bacterium]MDW8119658.1 50S ribosomal protein L9 [Chloroflexota bacterium]